MWQKVERAKYFKTFFITITTAKDCVCCDTILNGELNETTN